ncbi:Senescence-specific cysteine protease SAG39 [Linum grandiflorum]
MATPNCKFILLPFIFIMGALASHATARYTLSEASMRIRYEQWMTRYGGVYDSATEKEARFRIFKDSVAFIDSSNAVRDNSYKLGVNQFADLTNEEFKASRNGFKGHMCSPQHGPFRYENVSDVPTTMDWRKKGAVTPIKDQGQCGSCWAFSTVGSVEGIHQLKTGKLVSLSEHELVDCDTNGEDQGCSGGLMDDAFKFIIQNKGLTTETNYPYDAADGTCNANKQGSNAAKITGYEDVPANNEAAFMKAVASQPISVAIDAGDSSFQFYSSGIFTGECGTELDHGVTAVGYGESGGMKYWLVNNSWGAQWGEVGYIRMQKDVTTKEGLCGIAMQASYPTA